MPTASRTPPVRQFTSLDSAHLNLQCKKSRIQTCLWCRSTRKPDPRNYIATSQYMH